MKTLHIYSNRHIKDKVKTIKKGDWIYLENGFSKKRWSLYFRANNINENELNITYITQSEFFKLKNIKFDSIVGNPPYLREKWKKFMEHAVLLSDRVIMISPDGVTSMIETEKRTKFKNFLIDNGIQSMEDCTTAFPNVETGLIKVYDMDRTKDANISLFELDNSIDAVICRKIIAYSNQTDVNTLEVARRSSNNTDNGPQRRLLRNLGTKGGCQFETVNTNDATINADDYYFTNRFFGQNDKSPVFELYGEIVPSPNIFYIKRPDNMTVSTFKEIYDNPVFIYYINVAKGLGFDTPIRLMKTLPILMNGQDPIDIYNITEQEHDHIKEKLNAENHK